MRGSGGAAIAVLSIFVVCLQTACKQQVQPDPEISKAIESRQIARARSERQETTEPAAVSRHCLSAASPGFTARPVQTLFLDGHLMQVDEVLCHVDALQVSELGNWWQVRKTPDVEASLIGTSPFSGPDIIDFVPSPDGKYLAVFSSAEGIPYIQVVDLAEFIRRKSMKLIGELSPGIMGTSSLKGWKGGTLEVSSTVLIPYGTVLLGTDPEVFSWNVHTGTIVPQYKALRDPVRYYCGFLTAPDSYTRSEAATALRSFRTRSSATCIETALKLFPNDADLKSVLRYIQSGVE